MTVQLIASIALIGSVAWGSFELGQELKQGEWDAEKVRQHQANQAAQTGAGNAIAQAKAESVKVVTQVKTITRTVPVYRSAECQHDQRVLDDLNRALRGAGDGSVPDGSGGASRPDDGRNHGQVD